MKKIFIVSYAILSFLIILAGVFFVMLFTLKVDKLFQTKINVYNQQAILTNIDNWHKGEIIHIKIKDKDYYARIIKSNPSTVKIEIPVHDTSGVSILVFYGKEKVIKKIVYTYLKRYKTGLRR